MDRNTRLQFEDKIIDCFHFFTDPLDPVRVSIRLNELEDEVVFEANRLGPLATRQIPIAHTKSVEQFLNTPIDTLRAIAKGLGKEMRVVG